MNYLLDTHAFIWFYDGSNDLSKNARSIILDSSNGCFLSIASLWEIAIKSSVNKLTLKSSFDDIAAFMARNDIELLPISFEDLQILIRLPFHHRDPFDRIIIAQAISNKIPLVSKDKMFTSYPVKIIWD